MQLQQQLSDMNFIQCPLHVNIYMYHHGKPNQTMINYKRGSQLKWENSLTKETLVQVKEYKHVSLKNGK